MVIAWVHAECYKLHSIGLLAERIAHPRRPRSRFLFGYGVAVLGASGA